MKSDKIESLLVNLLTTFGKLLPMGSSIFPISTSYLVNAVTLLIDTMKERWILKNKLCGNIFSAALSVSFILTSFFFFVDYYIVPITFNVKDIIQEHFYHFPVCPKI